MTPAVRVTPNGALYSTTSVTTYDDGTNPAFRRQQIVSVVPVP